VTQENERDFSHHFKFVASAVLACATVGIHGESTALYQPTDVFIVPNFMEADSAVYPMITSLHPNFVHARFLLYWGA
jgi:hypothetical protein